MNGRRRALKALRALGAAAGITHTALAASAANSVMAALFLLP